MDPNRDDPSLERAREEAEGTELQEDPARSRALEREREEAQGVELFEDPDATVPRSRFSEGEPPEEDDDFEDEHRDES
ncbi:MAG: hypothetical protein DWQ20_04800 [Actinobacteria bacterium]|mgnify:CR=1 FL=1|nr:MAG: hypothetical protein DWQ20_04800 [Actinomycetota bacterium]